jgi:hypothetical protein
MRACRGSLHFAIAGLCVAFSVSCSSATVSDTPIAVQPPVASFSGDVFVSNDDGRNRRITVFPAGDVTPLRQFPVLGGSAVAADSTGMLYANVRDGIAAFAPGGSSITRTIKVDGPVFAMACDGHDNLYVLSAPTTRTSRIDEFGPGGTPHLRAITDRLSDTTSFAADDTGLVYAGNESGGANNDGFVSVYEPGASTASRTFDDTGHPRALAVDASRNLYVANSHLNSVDVYPPGSSAPAKRFTDHVEYPIMLAVDSTRQFLYVGPGRPASEIAGRLLSFDLRSGKLAANIDLSPRVLGLASSGDLYVIAGAQNQLVKLDVYPPGPGDHTQPKVIKTDITSPRALALSR